MARPRSGSEAAHIVLCPPDHYCVAYRIDPWMDPDDWSGHDASGAARARMEWQGLAETLHRLGVRLELVPPQPGVPDMVFTANSAVVLDRRVLLARFLHPQRRAEEPFLEAFFRDLMDRGLVDQVDRFPEGIRQEGAGDAHWDPARGLIWAGYGQRSDRTAADHMASYFGRRVEPLELVTEAYYHLDTCFCPLNGGEVLYFPPAFSADSRSRIREVVGTDDLLIEAEPGEARSFAVNAVNVGDALIMNACSQRLEAVLGERGYRVHRVPLSAFTESGTRCTR